ncbi:VWA domain-containing protein, partial [Myxococcota bacterium]|nr:VWA domain-containing protein [Myxococcota bacterium]
MYRLTLTTLVIGLGFIVTSAHAKSINRPADARRILEESIAKPDGTRPLRMDRADRRIVTTIMTEPGDIPQLKVEVDGKNLPLPLEHTHVHAELTGYVAEVEVTQTYNNPFTYPIEAIYIFPLPENSAVHAMKIVIGERIIEADIKKRQEARQIYQQAKASGHTAALLEQERPNIFTQSVANIAPGKRIDVVITYLQHLSYDAGEYEFVFPMVVGPRFHPGQATGTRKGHGYATDTHLVPDASRISPPVLGAGHRSGHDISIDLLADAGFPIGEFDVPTHQVDIHPTFDGSLAMQLSSSDTLPNRDFVLRYRVDASQPKATFIPHKDGEHGYFSLIVQPPRLDVEELVGQRELIFVVDVSGSMHGVPLSMCKAAMEEALGNLRPVDTFNVITFAGRTAQVFQSARPANNTNLRAATEFIDGLKAGGGTMMADGVRAALSPSIETGRHRYVFFLTDGYVGNEKQILDLTRRYITEQQKTSRARVFGFGVGSSVNRHLLDGFAKAGNGATFYSTTREDPARAVNGYFRLIDHPVISDVKIDFGGLDVDAIYPARLPDLFASRPLIINGRFKNAGSEIITIRGTANGRPVEIPLNITLPEVEGRNPAVKKLWARAKIDWLERDLWGGNNAQTIESITNLGLKFHLVTAFTSLVAVDKSQTVDGESKTILQPVETPEGVNAQMAGAATTAGMAGLGIRGGAA